MGAFVQRLGAMMMALMLYTTAATQVPLSLDGTFECSFNTWYVASVLPLEDGSILASGRMKFGNDLNFKNMMRFMPDGSRDMNFATNGAGGGAIKRWDNKLYVGVGQEVRRLYLDGELDNDFITMSTQPFYSAL
ncbi:MAG TPA: delta-60 repeat domain-containing protein, partial [Flavobacteriales bacterium]|nr:delta-60 repeat domain-containing protein [Flavobacteriales bacterium]